MNESKAQQWAREGTMMSQPRFYRHGASADENPMAWPNAQGELQMLSGTTTRPLQPNEALEFAVWIQETFGVPREPVKAPPVALPVVELTLMGTRVVGQLDVGHSIHLGMNGAEASVRILPR